MSVGMSADLVLASDVHDQHAVTRTVCVVHPGLLAVTWLHRRLLTPALWRSEVAWAFVAVHVAHLTTPRRHRPSSCFLAQTHIHLLNRFCGVQFAEAEKTGNFKPAPASPIGEAAEAPAPSIGKIMAFDGPAPERCDL